MMNGYQCLVNYNKIIMRINQLIQRFRHKWFFPVIGFFALIWFLVRVIPKPSRLDYPCMRASFPLASAFVLWLITTVGSLFHFKLALRMFQRSKILYGALFIVGALALFTISEIQRPRYKVVASELPDRYKNLDGITGSTYVNNDKEGPCTQVSIIQSDKDICLQIDYAEVVSMIRQAIQEVDGFNGLQDGDTVLLKPNLGSFDYKNGPVLPCRCNGMSTEWRVVQALVDLVREINPSGVVWVYEGGARDSVTTVYEILGYDSITGVDKFLSIEDLTTGYMDTTQPNLVPVQLDAAKNMYGDYAYYYVKEYFEADFVVTIPTLKVHGGPAVITGGIKNVSIGANPCDIYAPDAVTLSRGRINHNDQILDRFIHDYYMGRPVDLVVYDGLQAMQRGAHAYEADTMNMRLILASRDAVAADAIAALIMCQDNKMIDHLNYLGIDNVGYNDAICIQIKGNRKVDEVKTFFANWENKAKYYDLEGPDFTIDQVVIVNDTMHIHTTPGMECVKMGIQFNEEEQDSFQTGSFDYFAWDVSGKGQIDSLVIHSYDRYLNRVSKSFQLTISDANNQKPAENKVIVFPVPFDDECTITIEGDYTGTVVIRITNAVGMLVGNLILEKAQEKLFHILSMPEAESGMYVVDVSLGKERIVKKIIKEY
jgi:uncharacterized protein (DUF362 family)